MEVGEKESPRNCFARPRRSGELNKVVRLQAFSTYLRKVYKYAKKELNYDLNQELHVHRLSATHRKSFLPSFVEDCPIARIDEHQALAKLVTWLTTGEGAGHVNLCEYLVSIDKELQKRARRAQGLPRAACAWVGANQITSALKRTTGESSTPGTTGSSSNNLRDI